MRKLSNDKHLQKQLWAHITKESNNAQEALDIKEGQALVEKALMELTDQKRMIYRLSREQRIESRRNCRQIKSF